eukprot:gnl/MRDRNA2_/MRDRNA2_25610_c0_seq1.p1 gnl/MRDRNA2_/MRDRNA2_25610_c0~~gnl/MRDRNA2_/MRDRNA2_25610_c0_seq1.p1  ORF type:complete len:162 (+),score=23.05 gnl/MRDRNA2_/MRDRNA2_25610_c0_seq1:264-749(+)
MQCFHWAGPASADELPLTAVDKVRGQHCESHHPSHLLTKTCSTLQEAIAKAEAKLSNLGVDSKRFAIRTKSNTRNLETEKRYLVIDFYSQGLFYEDHNSQIQSCIQGSPIDSFWGGPKKKSLLNTRPGDVKLTLSSYAWKYYNFATWNCQHLSDKLYNAAT